MTGNKMAGILGIKAPLQGGFKEIPALRYRRQHKRQSECV